MNEPAPRGKYADHSDTTQAATLTVLAANRGNITQTAKDTGIPESTIRGWRNGAGVNEETRELSRHKKEELATRFDALVDKLLLSIDDAKIKEAGLVPITTAIGTLVDKAAFLRKEAAPTNEELDALEDDWADAIKSHVSDPDTLAKIAEDVAKRRARTRQQVTAGT